MHHLDAHEVAVPAKGGGLDLLQTLKYFGWEGGSSCDQASFVRESRREAPSPLGGDVAAPQMK